MAFIFVSYSRKDRDFVKRIIGDLRKRGIPVWLDTKDIAPGERWDMAIEHALDKSTHVLFVMSAASTVSNNVRDELDTAIDGGKIILPILLNDCTPPLRTRRLEYIDFRGDYDQALEELFEKLPQEVKTEIDSIPVSAVSPPLAATRPNAAALPIRQIALGAGLVILILAGLIGAFALGSRKGSATPTQVVVQAASLTPTVPGDSTLPPIVQASTPIKSGAQPSETLTDTPTPAADIPSATVVADVPTDTPTADVATDIATTSATNPSFISNLSGWKMAGKTGTWDMTEDGLQGISVGNSDTFYVANNDDSDFTYDTTFIISEGSSIASAGVIFRSVSTSNPFKGAYMVRVSVANGGQINIVKLFGGNQYKQLDIQYPHIDFGTHYTIKVMVKGDVITAYLNDLEMIQAQDSDFTHGAVGLNVFGGTTLFHDANLTIEPTP